MPNDNLASPLKSKDFWKNAGILLCVSVWMFFVGVLVGRGTMPIKFDIPKLEEKLIGKRLAAEKKETAAVFDSEEDGHGTDLEFYEDLKTDLSNDKLPPVKRAETIVTDPESESVSDPNQGEGVTESASATGRYTVQVASLRSEASAKSIADKLIEKGYRAFVASSSTSDSGVWYRVRIGNYKNKSDATKMADRMSRESFKPIVVRRK